MPPSSSARDDEIDQVIDVLNRRRRNNAQGFILVLGASGCGKSSLVRAGVLPRLRRAVTLQPFQPSSSESQAAE